jgi:hypothetical protein
MVTQLDFISFCSLIQRQKYTEYEQYMCYSPQIYPTKTVKFCMKIYHFYELTHCMTHDIKDFYRIVIKYNI